MKATQYEIAVSFTHNGERHTSATVTLAPDQWGENGARQCFERLKAVFPYELGYRLELAEIMPAERRWIARTTRPERQRPAPDAREPSCDVINESRLSADQPHD